MRTNENLNSSPEQSETPSLNRHQKKLIGYYLSGGDNSYIFNSSHPNYNEDQVTEKERGFVLQSMQTGENNYARLEKQLLHELAPFNPPKTTDQIYEGLKDDRQGKRILAYMTGVNWNQFDTVSGSHITRFLSKYPTPLEFEKSSEDFLQLIADNNSINKYYEYVDSMDNFCSQIYGKKYEYYKAMKSLHEAAAEEYGKEEPLHTRGQKHHFGEKFLKIWGEKHEAERLIADSGVASFNKGNLIGHPERRNEDATYYNPKAGIFAVFDGAGGMNGAARASGIAAAVLRESVEDATPENTEDMADIMESINDAIHYDQTAGHSTGVVGRVLEKNGQKSLLYASVGDSRIYLIRNGKARAITIDEGSGNIIYNSLGRETAKIKQVGEIPLKKGDNIVFCSDGITGDFEKDFIPDEELAKIVEHASSAAQATNALIKRATKIDDRTALVVRV